MPDTETPGPSSGFLLVVAPVPTPWRCRCCGAVLGVLAPSGRVPGALRLEVAGGQAVTIDGARVAVTCRRCGRVRAWYVKPARAAVAS